MTKTDELAVLRGAIEKLGPDSYCGPWLASVLPGIEADMRSDNTVNVLTPAEWYRRGEADYKATMALAADNAARLTAATKKDIDAQHINLERHRRQATSAVAQALKLLEAQI